MQTFERRSKYVKKGNETKYWDCVAPEMMSDEEKRGDTYVRHQPEYRSQLFTDFIDKLDERCAKKQSNHARYKRIVGTPCKVPIPAGIKSWMTNHQMTQQTSSLNKDEQSEPDGANSSELSDDGDEIEEDLSDCSSILFEPRH